MRERVLGLGAAVLLVLALGACGDEADDAGGADEAASAHDHAEEEAAAHDEAADAGPPPFSESEATTVVETTLRDYAFTGIPTTVKGPNVVFEATIAGSNTHELEVVDQAGEPVDEIPAFKGATPKSLAVVLAPGTYTVQCLVKEGTRTHAQLGMKQQLTVE